MKDCNLSTIGHQLHDLVNKVDNLTDKQNDILVQVTRTNGRVSELERDRIIRDTELKIYKWVGTLATGIAASVTVAVIVFYAIGR